MKYKGPIEAWELKLRGISREGVRFLLHEVRRWATAELYQLGLMQRYLNGEALLGPEMVALGVAMQHNEFLRDLLMRVKEKLSEVA